MIDLFLYDTINKSSARDMVNQLLFTDGEEVTIHINSVGGNIFDGWSIINTMLTLQNNGQVVNTHIAGIAGSMAGVIAMFGSNVSMNDFGLLMIHDPSFGGKPPRDRQQREIIEKVKNSLMMNFTNRRNIDKMKLENMMAAETWLDSSESIEAGLVDNIVSTGIEIEVENKSSDYILELVNQVSKKPKIEMKNICNILDINETTDENVVVDKIETLKNGFESTVSEKDGEIETLTNSVEELTNTNEELNNEVVALKKTIAENLVNQAIADGKIEESSKETWVNMAVENVENATTLIDSFKSQPVKITNMIEGGEGGNEGEDDKKVLAEKFDHMRKTDSKGLQNLMNEDFETYSKMYEAKFGTKPVKK